MEKGRSRIKSGRPRRVPLEQIQTLAWYSFINTAVSKRTNKIQFRDISEEIDNLFKAKVCDANHSYETIVELLSKINETVENINTLNKISTYTISNYLNETSTSWSKIAKAERSPSDTTLNLVNQRIKRSKFMFTDGPYNIFKVINSQSLSEACRIIELSASKISEHFPDFARNNHEINLYAKNDGEKLNDLLRILFSDNEFTATPLLPSLLFHPIRFITALSAGYALCKFLNDEAPLAKVINYSLNQISVRNGISIAYFFDKEGKFFDDQFERARIYLRENFELIQMNDSNARHWDIYGTVWASKKAIM